MSATACTCIWEHGVIVVHDPDCVALLLHVMFEK